MGNRTKELREVLKAAEERGWEHHKTNGGHIRLLHPDGGLVFCSETPSDHRALANTKARIALQERMMAEGDQKSLAEDAMDQFDEHFDPVCQHEGCGRRFASGWGLFAHYDKDHGMVADANTERVWVTCQDCGRQDAEMVNGEVVCNCQVEQPEPGPGPEPELETDVSVAELELEPTLTQPERLEAFIREQGHASAHEIAGFLGRSLAQASVVATKVAKRCEDIVRAPREEGGGLILEELVADEPEVIEDGWPEPEELKSDFECFEVVERIDDGPIVLRDEEGRVWVAHRPS